MTAQAPGLIGLPAGDAPGIAQPVDRHAERIDHLAAVRHQE
jgi:hypothetical protein